MVLGLSTEFSYFVMVSIGFGKPTFGELSENYILHHFIDYNFLTDDTILKWHHVIWTNRAIVYGFMDTRDEFWTNMIYNLFRSPTSQISISSLLIPFTLKLYEYITTFSRPVYTKSWKIWGTRTWNLSLSIICKANFVLCISKNRKTKKMS